MINDLKESQPFEDEINLKKIFKLLIESKKLIILTILIFTLAGIFYSLSQKTLFLSSAKLEIGYVEMLNGDKELIQSPSDTITELKILIFKNSNGKFNQNISINPFEGKLIILETTSGSVEDNEDILNEIINYINERHSNLAAFRANQTKDKISYQTNLIKNEISYLKESIQADIESKVLNLENDLPFINQEINQLNQLILDDSKNLKLLKEKDLYLERAAQSPTLEQIISSYKSKVNELTRLRNNTISDLNTLSYKLDSLKKNTFQSDELYKLTQSLNNAKNNLQESMTQNSIKTDTISGIETKAIKPKILSLILLSSIVGFISGCFLLFINNFIKSFREESEA